jgi:hypothetical protein
VEQAARLAASIGKPQVFLPQMFIRHRPQISRLVELQVRRRAVKTTPMPTHIPSAPKYQYRRRLPHFQKSDAPLFITFCAGGALFLPEDARDLVLNHCLRDHGVRVELFAAVVMPDHVHLLLRALRDE